MNKIYLFVVFLICSGAIYAQEEKIPDKARKLMLAYPEKLKGYSDNYILFKDGTKLIFSDNKDSKTHSELINNASIKDMFAYVYPQGVIGRISKNQDPGRIRQTDFFKKMYGNAPSEVQKNLKELIWCPKLIGQKIRITTTNHVYDRLQEVSVILDEHPAWKQYLKLSGDFYWRNVRGSNNLSAHSFGIAIDLNVKFSNFWQWDCKCNDENVDLSYKNQIPQEIVKIFEEHGFIWGGKWYHYDTMHFEYRPELLIK